MHLMSVLAICVHTSSALEFSKTLPCLNDLQLEPILFAKGPSCKMVKKKLFTFDSHENKSQRMVD